MKKIVFAGDSHTAIFRPFADDVLAIYHRGALTMDSFSRGSSLAYHELEDFLTTSINIKGCSLILCLSEVDIRVHFWRDMPVLESRGMSFDEFLQHKVDSFIERVDALAKRLKIPDIILWGAPASQLTMDNHSEELPATGDNITRNILTHLLNVCIIKTISTRPTMLRFSTPFYGMVSDDFVTDPTWLHDGVHLNFGLRSHCAQLLQPVIDRTAMATFTPKFYELENATFKYLSLAREPDEIPTSLFFRTWIQTDTKSEITLENKFGHFSLVNSMADLGEKRKYNELVMRRKS